MIKYAKMDFYFAKLEGMCLKNNLMFLLLHLLNRGRGL